MFLPPAPEGELMGSEKEGPLTGDLGVFFPGQVLSRRFKLADDKFVFAKVLTIVVVHVLPPAPEGE